MTSVSIRDLRKFGEADFVGWKYYLVFTVCSFTNAILFFCLFPETKGVSISGANPKHEADNHSEHSRKWISTSRTATGSCHLPRTTESDPRTERGISPWVSDQRRIAELLG